MTIPASVIARLAGMGLDAVHASEVAEMLAEVERATKQESDEAIERRRVNEAARTTRYRSRGGGQIDEDVRSEVLARDDYRCVTCGSDDHLQIDHVKPLAKGGGNEIENLQVLCRVCNARKRDRVRKREARASTDVRGQARISVESAETPSPDKETPHTPKKLTPTNIPPSPPKGGSSPTTFDRFWSEYPQKVGKREAEKAFAKARKRASFDAIMGGLARYVAKTDDRPWCNPSTWLNQARWTDQPAILPHRTADPPRYGQRQTPAERKSKVQRQALDSMRNEFDEPRKIASDNSSLLAGPRQR